MLPAGGIEGIAHVGGEGANIVPGADRIDPDHHDDIGDGAFADPRREVAPPS